MPELDKKTQILLKIYSEAQSSAQHHDQLVWVSITLVIAGILALTGSVASEVINNKVSDSCTVAILGIFVFVLGCIALFFASCYRNIKHNKYRILKNIEAELVLRYNIPLEYTQHLVLDGFEAFRDTLQRRLKELKERELGDKEIEGMEQIIKEVDRNKKMYGNGGFQPYKRRGWKLLRALVWLVDIFWILLIGITALQSTAFCFGISSYYTLVLLVLLFDIETFLIGNIDEIYKNLLIF